MPYAYRPTGFIAAIRNGRASTGDKIGNCVADGGGADRCSRQVAHGHLSRNSRTEYSRTCPSLHAIRSAPLGVSSNLVGCSFILCLDRKTRRPGDKESVPQSSSPCLPLSWSPSLDSIYRSSTN